jgi:LPXTG-motif cell wall-anchored protein
MKVPPKVVKWLIIVGVVILVSLLVYFLIKKRKNELNSDPDKIDDININSSDLSISDNQANIICQNILEAMDKRGTDEETIISNLTGLNQADLLLIIKKFGLKYYNGERLSRGWLSEKLSRQMNLLSWLKAELSGSDLETVKTIFTSKNIAF